MSLPQEPIEAILRDQGIDPEKKLKTGTTAFGYLEACIMSALDEIEDDDDKLYDETEVES